MGRDLLTRPYGRFYHLPRLLARRGHQVSVLLCSYKREPDEFDVVDKDNIHWHSASLATLNPFSYYLKARQLVKAISPDWIVGFSDTYYGIMAHHLAARFGNKSMIDAYDNYESYLSWCKPLHLLWRRALAKADLVTAAGPQLAGLMGRDRQGKSTIVLPMAADPIGFKPLDKIKCRQQLALPTDKKIIGYCGSIHPSRGIDLLFDAYKILSRQDKDIELVLTGNKAPGVTIPDGARWLGYLPDEQMPALLNSMDVLTVINKDSAFGNFSYPVKLYEAMCCQVPVVAIATPATEWIMQDQRELLTPPGDSCALSRKISSILHECSQIDYEKKEGWQKEAVLLEQALKNHL